MFGIGELRERIQALDEQLGLIDRVQDDHLDLSKQQARQMVEISKALNDLSKQLQMAARQAAGNSVGLADLESRVEDLERSRIEQQDILYGIIAQCELQVTWHPEATTREQWTVEKGTHQGQG